ncbi:TonB-dependent receptor plug domain-containing protein [Fodinibius salsisoli]|uniref:TonB-dependent receptor n=1 Tax=Fodinibius salsisoli TaxID=2820877 RepID=A0ABT3PQC2_9BACT|nr:TonB-dependent receptor [Fodinibius salsisoli]MCW9708058.1 TonB-dependent receptor [Fodinibius salsisoli]
MSKLWIRYSTALCSCVLFFIHHLAYSQVISDTLQLEEIEVVATRIQQPLKYQPTHVEVIDSVSLSMQSVQNIGEVLNSSSMLFIKDNGPGGIATASQRGLSASQVQVLWEGIPINSVMAGQTDYSLLPASLFSTVQISSGNPSSAFGGGSLSGAIYLSSDRAEYQGVSIGQSVGSFGQWQSSLNGQIQSGNWRVHLKSAVSRDENDFEYYNRAFDQEEYRTHNRQEQENIIAGIGYSQGNKQFESKFWFADSKNEIPGTILTSNSQSRQDDQSMRWLSRYQTYWGEAEFTFKNYVDRSELNYFDSKADTRSISTTRRWLISSAFDYKINNNVLLKGELSGSLSGVETNNYTGLKTRQQFSALLNPEFETLQSRVHIYPALRLDSYNDFGTVLSPTLGVNYALRKDKLFLRGQLSRDFNPPTFNALYWLPGGDPNLKPERSNNAEAGLVYYPRWLSFSTVTLTSFYNRVNEGLRWTPNETGNYVPENVDQVTSKGLETSLTNRFTVGRQWNLVLEQSANYVHAQITEPRFDGDEALGNQLRYIPKWNYQASLRAQRTFLSAFIQYKWTNRRYTTDTQEFASSLKPYHLLHATLQLQQQYFGVNFQAQTGVRNLLNTDYEIIQWYAMPQRNYHLSLTATYEF